MLEHIAELQEISKGFFSFLKKNLINLKKYYWLEMTIKVHPKWNHYLWHQIHNLKGFDNYLQFDLKIIITIINKFF